MEGDDDRAAKEAAERKRLANEALAAAAAAKKAQQERAAKAQQETATETPPPPAPAAAAAAVAAAPAAADETPAAADAPSTDEDAATPAEASAATAEGDDEGAPAPAPAAPGLVASWVSAGTAGLKVAAGVGANLAAGAAEATRTSLIKVQEATRNISFASADSVRYTKLYDTFVKQSGTIEITVNANAVTQIPFFVPKGRAIVWKVLVKALDVAFSMKLRVQEMGGAVEHELEAEQRVAAGTFFVGDRKAIDFEDRHVVVFFDNRALPRGLRAKTLAYKVTVAAPEVVAGVKDEYAKEAEEFAAQAAAAKAEAPPATTEPASEEDGAAASEGDAATTKGGVGLVGNLLNYSSTVISTAQTNATILVQKAQENPRVSGALQFLQTKGAGVGSVFGKLNVWGKKAEADDAAAAATEDATPTEEAAPEAAAGAAAAAAPSPKSPKGDADDSFTESDAPAAFVSVDLGGAKPN